MASMAVEPFWSTFLYRTQALVELEPLLNILSHVSVDGQGTQVKAATSDLVVIN